MIKALIVGFVFLGSLTAHAQGVALQRVITLASTQGKTSTSMVMKDLFSQVEGASGALAQTVKNDPLYVFSRGSMTEESLQYLGVEAQNALLQIGKNTTFKSISSLSEFQNAESSVRSLSRASEGVSLSANGKVKVAVSPELAIEQEVRSLGLSESVTAELSSELKTFRTETGISYTNRGMCKGLDDEAATNFVGFLRDARENLKRTRAKCPGQFYGSIAEVWINFQKRMGRQGDSLWRAVQKNQVCYTSSRLRPGVLNAVSQISEKNSGAVPAESELSGCPL
jgi:hypothetical protein